MSLNENPAPKRESFTSRLGFLLVSAGCAIGIGNVWRFPTVAGQSGGGVFVLFYLIFLLAMGVPVLTMELAVGRAGRGTATQAYRALEKKGAKWHLHGYLCLLGCCTSSPATAGTTATTSSPRFTRISPSTSPA